MSNRSANNQPEGFNGNGDPDDFLEDYKEKRKLLVRWSIYFPNEQKKDFDPNDFKHLAVQVFFEAFQSPNYSQYLEWEKKDDNFEQIVVYINFQNFHACGNPNIKQFLEYLGDHPNDLIKSVSLALDNARQYVFGAQDQRIVVVRFTNFSQIFSLSAIKSHLINKFVCVRGTVLRCYDCKAKIPMHFIDGKWETPNRCINVDCRCKIFNPEKHTARTSFFQRIRIQEIENDVKDINAGKLPKTLDCEIKDDLIDACISGDIVTICGIMKTELQNDQKGFGGQKFQKNKALHSSYIDVNSIKNSNTDYFLAQAVQSTEESCAVLYDNKVNLSELNQIHKISERKDLFPLLVKSICPSIFGHELVKTGLILCLFGGTDYRLKNKGDFADFILCRDEKSGNNNDEDMDDESQHPTIRPDIHLMMVGEPGLGKSQMLKHVINVAPRGVYVCGNSTTNAGLTATLIRDQTTNEQNLEAGALVLSDLGVCCIDEFDKMSSDQHTLLEAMEQQTISIAKGGILGSLSARCSLITAANPASGHYNRSRSILDNIRVSNAILSRFDLVFLMLDDPDLERDMMLSKYIMEQHQRNKKRNLTSFQQSVSESEIQSDPSMKRMRLNDAGIDCDDIQSLYNSQMTEKQENINYKSLLEKIVHLTTRIKDEEKLEPSVLKKYISYAKHTVFPKLSMEACEVLKDFYISLRENACNNSNTLPITSRQLDSLIRLSQARAKLELRNLVTREDAIDVVKLIQESLFEACSVEMGIRGGGSTVGKSYSLQSQSNNQVKGKKGGNNIDANNVSMLSIPKQTKFYVEKLRNIADEKGNGVFEFAELISIAKSINLQVGDFRNLIEKLNSQGVVIMKNSKTYELVQG